MSLDVKKYEAPAMLSKPRSKKYRLYFVLPAVICVLLLTLFPLLYSLSSSFRDIHPLNKNTPFIGFKNFIGVFQDQQFIHALGITLLISVIAVIVELIIGMVVAVNTARLPKGKSIVVSLALLPVFMVPVVVGYMWRYLLAAQFGPINQIIGWILNKEFHYDWLNTKVGSIVGLELADIWQWSPFMFLVLFAGINNVLPEHYEAASVDGCSAWQSFRFITLPLIKPAIIIAVTIRSVDVLKLFDTVWTMTAGGPGTFSQTMTMNIYLLGFQSFRLGYASAASYIVLIVSILASSVLIFILTRDTAKGGVSRG